MSILLKPANLNVSCAFNISAVDITGLIYIYSYKNNRSYKTIDQHRYILYGTACIIYPLIECIYPCFPELSSF